MRCAVGVTRMCTSLCSKQSRFLPSRLHAPISPLLAGTTLYDLSPVVPDGAVGRSQIDGWLNVGTVTVLPLIVQTPQGATEMHHNWLVIPARQTELLLHEVMRQLE